MGLKLCLLGACYCKHKQGYPNMNEIMCNTNKTFEQLDPCHQNEACVGPKTPDKAKVFSTADFCSKGALRVLLYKSNCG